MGVYIPTMKMPRDCLDCDLFIDKWEDSAYCAIGVNCDTCPLIEVKTPHGRLTDADAIKDELKEIFAITWHSHEELGEKADLSEIEINIPLRTIHKILDKASTVIEAEE